MHSKDFLATTVETVSGFFCFMNFSSLKQYFLVALIELDDSVLPSPPPPELKSSEFRLANRPLRYFSTLLFAPDVYPAFIFFRVPLRKLCIRLCQFNTP
jgi:hypothetical protein